MDPLKGSGARSGLSKEAADLLGLEAPGTPTAPASRAGSVRTASVAQSAGARTLLGLHSVQTGAASLLGLKSAQVAAGASVGPALGAEELPEDYKTGDGYACPCGWRPDSGQLGPARRTAAVKHWRNCQGTKPPALTKEQQRLATLAGRPATSGSAEKGIRAHQKWFSDFEARDPAAAAVACRPCTDVAFSSPDQRRLYACTKCGKQKCLPLFRRLPCSSREKGVINGRITAEITLQRWVTSAQGEAFWKKGHAAA